ncbi:TAXI family TRAP transporter solute-binding subunit [Lyticum sinuosum]|uniref:TAXI family TRAP transporter solute-binding subunit n=1 Tax=Lyticum sinuosum TaxID=1332059 RepID=UPI002ACD72EF|nr:TAXI family TRAP transporter solute-binding subunit [Lyticum sinuosum]
MSKVIAEEPSLDTKTQTISQSSNNDLNTITSNNKSNNAIDKIDNKSKIPIKNRSQYDSSKLIIDDKEIKIAAAGVNTSKDRISMLLCLYVNNVTLKKYRRCSNINTNSDLESIIAVQNGYAQFAIVGENFEKQALVGSDLFKNRKFESLRSIIPLYKETLTILVKSSSGFKKINDLFDKKIAISPQKTSSRYLFDQIIGLYGINYNKFKDIDDSPIENHYNNICTDKIDGTIALIEHPNEYIKNISRSCEIDIIPLDDNIIDKLIQTYSEYQNNNIKPGLYIGVPFNVKSISLNTSLISNSDVSDEMVFFILKALLDNQDVFTMTYPFLQDFSIKKSLEIKPIAPKHSGVNKFIDKFFPSINEEKIQNKIKLITTNTNIDTTNIRINEIDKKNQLSTNTNNTGH